MQSPKETANGPQLPTQQGLLARVYCMWGRPVAGRARVERHLPSRGGRMNGINMPGCLIETLGTSCRLTNSTNHFPPCVAQSSYSRPRGHLTIRPFSKPQAPAQQRHAMREIQPGGPVPPC
jgi:hypothetical protein